MRKVTFFIRSCNLFSQTSYLVTRVAQSLWVVTQRFSILRDPPNFGCRGEHETELLCLCLASAVYTYRVLVTGRLMASTKLTLFFLPFAGNKRLIMSKEKDCEDIACTHRTEVINL